MRQVVITRKGLPEVLRLREVLDPQPGPGMVRIRVAAAGVNFADLMMRQGLYPDAPPLPAVPGYEVAGAIDAVGAGVVDWQVGQDVIAMTRFGGYSEAVCVPAKQVYVRPAEVSAEQGAALPVNYLTAYQMLMVMARVQAGDTVLVHGAAGGVGLAAVQLCQLQQARVIGSASPSKHNFLREQGVQDVFDSRQQDFAEEVRAATGGRGVDIALEPRHGRWIMESYRALSKAGQLVLFGFSSAAESKHSGRWSALKTLGQVPWLTLNPIRLMNDNKAIAGVNLGRMWDRHEMVTAWVTQLLDWLAAGKVKPHVDRAFAFREAAAAHHYLHDRRNLGKVVLVPDPPESAETHADVQEST
jgi:NADPH:quinone reductase-like Zn-dependent oxidoreductase